MTRPRSRRLLTLLAAAGALAVVVLVAARWQDIAAWVEFYRQFESVGLNEQGYAEYRHRQTGIVMVRVPGGTFLMGTSEEEAERIVAESKRAFDESPQGSQRIARFQELAFMEAALKTEQPQHEVTLRSFLIGKYEVVQREWKRVSEHNPSSFQRDNLPVETATWDESREFCRGASLELPTEAQWEYACRAGTTGPYSGPIDQVAWHRKNRDGPDLCPAPVGRKAANAFGLHDMHGNVAEWCLDLFNEEFYATKAAAGPDPNCQTPGSMTNRRVTRGGSALGTTHHLRSSARRRVLQRDRYVGRGFRAPLYPLPPGL